MKRNASVVLIIFCLVFFTLTAMELDNLSKARALIPPEETPPGYRIYSDGTYDVENLRRDGNIYTLTGNVQGTIVIERDGVVLDGAGYTLQGDGSSHGIWLQDKSGVAIKNLNIKNFDNGIRFSHYVANWYAGETNPKHPTDCTIKACNITNSNSGIAFSYSSNCSVVGNYIAHNTYGMQLSGSGHILRNNRIEQNQYNFWETDEQINDVDASNTINSKPIYYWVDRHNLKVPAGAGAVILKYCSGITVQNLNLSENGNGISLFYTNNSEIIGNAISDNYWRGIKIWWSNNNSIIGNHITNTPHYGIEIYDSHNNTYSHNLIKNNKCGIYSRTTSTGDVISSNQVIGNKDAGIDGGINAIITKNYVFSNGAGISAWSNCFIAENIVTQNTVIGLVFRSNNLVMSNYISKNNVGLGISIGTDNTVTLNSIVENVEWGIDLIGYEASINNLIFKNNFIDNNNKGTQAHVKISGASNSWDDGVEGNYWSDHDGDGSYYIDENNQDKFPLLEPLEFAALEIPAIPQPQITETSTTDPATTEPTAKPTTEPTSDSTPEPFPAVPVAIASAVSIAMVTVALLVYFKKRKH